ncbi:STM3941 family protein [Flavobacterium sp. RS13.1]|uniref:STM3941 family protein n=1 Tax=Flavobacterium sp. RS13.1 TaxID=3400345 RepID=UPI003AACAE35
MQEIKLYKSLYKAIILLLGSTAFVVIGFFIKAENPFIAWLCIGFFGLGIFVGLFNLFDRRPQIIINEFGIYDRNTLKDFINWELIYDAYLINIRSQKFVCLVIDEKYRPSNNKNKWYKLAAKLNEEIGAQEMNISLGHIDINAERFLEFILKMNGGEVEIRSKLLEDGIKIFNI